MIYTPLELLQSKLKEIERNLEKSNEMFENKKITSELHLIHKSNLLPKIGEYQLAIFQLTEMNKKTFN